MAGISITIHDNFTPELARKLGETATKSEHAMAMEIMNDTTPFVPALNLVLTRRTQVFGNVIYYPPPYARYLYYGKVMVDRETGLPAFRIVGKDGSEIFRFREGAKLKPIDRPLKYNKSVHPQATDHWIDASKRKNMKKWEKMWGGLIADGLNKR